MENTKKKVERLPSTIVIGILLGLALLLLSIAYLINVQEVIREQNANQDSTLGEGIGVALIVVMLIIAIFVTSISSFLIAGISLPFSIRNRKATITPIRVLSFVYDGVSGVIILFAILRIVLLYLGVL